MAGPRASAVIRRPESASRSSPKDRRTHDDEECRPPPPPKRRPGRPRRVRQDDAGRAAALPGRRDPAARSRRRRVGPPRLRARGAEAPRIAEPRGRHVRIRRDAHLARRHARATRTSSPRSSRASPPPTARIFVVDASGGVEAGLEQRSRTARATDTAACFFINKSDRENANPTEALDALRATFGTKIAPLHLAIGAAETFEGYVDLVHRKAWKFDGSKEVEIPIPDELAGEVATRRDQLLEAAAEADDDVLDEVPRGRGGRGRRARGVPPQGRQGIGPGAGPRRVRGQGHRPAGAARRDRPLPALAGRRAAGRGARQERRDGGHRGRRERPAPGPRVQDDRGPVRRAADLPARAVRHAPFAGARLEHDAQRRRADRPAAAAPRQGAGADRRAARPARSARSPSCPRPRPATRWPPRTSSTCCPTLEFPEPTLVVAIEPQTKADLDKMGPALQRMLEEEPTVHLERSDVGEQLLRTIGEAQTAVIIERLKRKFGSAIVTRLAEGPLQGDDPRHDQGPRPLQEADRWPRHVRRRVDRARAEPGRRRRVRREGRRRLGPAPVLPGRREGHPRDRGRGRRRRLPAVRLQGDALRRLVPQRRLERAVVQDRRVDGAQGGRPQRQPGPARADHGRPRSRSRRRSWARSTATSTAGAAACWGWTPTTGMQVISAHVPQAELFSTRRSCAHSPADAARSRATLDHYEDVPSHLAERIIQAHRKELESNSH